MTSGVNNRYRVGGHSPPGVFPVVDAHAHLFTPAIMRSMAGRPAVLAELDLDVPRASERLAPADLDRSAEASGVRACLLLPTAPPDGVDRANQRHRRAADAHPRLATASTLHPRMEGRDAAIEEALGRSPSALKLSSFTQRFDPLGAGALALFDAVEATGARLGMRPVVVLDTYTRAAEHFRCEPAQVTTPARLARLVERHPGVDWVGAHMGGLAASADELRRDLVPRTNLYLDTSNAAHVLPAADFVGLLQEHGPDQVMFGTDWPWFAHGEEIPRIRDLLERAGFDGDEQSRVFGGNAARLYGL